MFFPEWEPGSPTKFDIKLANKKRKMKLKQRRKSHSADPFRSCKADRTLAGCFLGALALEKLQPRSTIGTCMQMCITVSYGPQGAPILGEWPGRIQGEEFPLPDKME